VALERRIVPAGALSSAGDAASAVSARETDFFTEHYPSRNESRSAVHKRQLFTETLIALAIPLIALSTLQLLKFSTISTVESFAYGEWVKYSHTAAVLIILAAATVAFVAFGIESRRRRRVEDALFRTQEHVLLSAEATDVGLWEWNSATDDFQISGHGRELLRLPSRAALTLNSILDAVHPDDRSATEQVIDRALRSSAGFDVEFRLCPIGGRIRWIRLRSRPAHESDAHVNYMTGTILDVTDRSEMKLEIERQRESLAHLTRVGMIGKLSSALAHELNQPLTAIMSNAQAAQRIITKLPLDMNELKSAISDIIQDDARAGDVIRHLRGMLKNNADFFEELDLNAIVASALELTQGDLVARHISVTTCLWKEPLLIKGDSVQLQQVLLNLFLNAAEAISELGRPAGSITVTSTILSDGYASVGVSDNGPGIESQSFATLFDPFFSTKEGGMGLGLSISRNLILRHRGQMWAANNPERGASFYFSVPLVRSSAQ
jgi:C4-dicarboxylate-specific signal transduction histidine kinase